MKAITIIAIVACLFAVSEARPFSFNDAVKAISNEFNKAKATVQKGFETIKNFAKKTLNKGLNLVKSKLGPQVYAQITAKITAIAQSDIWDKVPAQIQTQAAVFIEKYLSQMNAVVDQGADFLDSLLDKVPGLEDATIADQIRVAAKAKLAEFTAAGVEHFNHAIDASADDVQNFIATAVEAEVVASAA